MTNFSITEGSRGRFFNMNRHRHQKSLSRFHLPLLTLISCVVIPAPGLGATDSRGSQHRLDPNSDVSVRMTVTYEVPFRLDPGPINTFRASDFEGSSYRETTTHIRSSDTGSGGSLDRGGSVAIIRTSDYLPTRSVDPNSRSVSSTCTLPDQCISARECAPGGIYLSCGSGRMCCPPRTVVAVVSAPASASPNAGSRISFPKTPAPTKSSVAREPQQNSIDEGLPAAFHGYLLLSEHPRMPPSAPNLPRATPTSGGSAKSAGRTKPEIVRTLEYESGRYGGPPVRLGTAGSTPLSKLKQKETDLLPDDNTCGPVYVDSRITKGKDAQPGQFPWMALLGFRTPPKTTVNFICAGSLINDRYVLTAAHCFTTQNVLAEVRLGEFDLSRDPDGTAQSPAEPVRKEEAEEVIIHPNFSRSTLGHDIALIRLRTRLREYTSTIKPICLPLDVTFRGKNYTIAGWGKTDYSHANGSRIIQTTNVELINHTDCAKRAAPYNLPLTTDQICAGGNQGHDVCSGDSGGPLTKIDAGNSPTAQSVNFIVGIVSFGADMPCGTAGLPSVYTKVTSYLSWILENLKTS